MIKRVPFFDLQLVDADPASLAVSLLDDVQHKRGARVMSVNLTALRLFRGELARHARNAEVVTADGRGFVKLSGVMGSPIEHQAAISDLAEVLNAHCAERGLAVYLLGATEETNARARCRLRGRYPGIRVAGHHGYFSEQDAKMLDSIAAEIKASGARCVLIGISSPKKERVMQELYRRDPGVVYVACGGYLDILAGRTLRAPRLVRQLSLEWIYRFTQEPQRLFGPMLVSGLYSLFVLVPRLAVRARSGRARMRIEDALS